VKIHFIASSREGFVPSWPDVIALARHFMCSWRTNFLNFAFTKTYITLVGKNNKKYRKSEDLQHAGTSTWHKYYVDVIFLYIFQHSGNSMQLCGTYFEEEK